MTLAAFITSHVSAVKINNQSEADVEMVPFKGLRSHVEPDPKYWKIYANELLEVTLNILPIPWYLRQFTILSFCEFKYKYGICDELGDDD